MSTTSLKVQAKEKTNNPFYGLKYCLQLFQNAGKGAMITPMMLDQAFNEIRDDKEKREMFFSLLFSIGDITNREHNIFKKNKVDGGGNAQREAFMNILEWMKVRDFKQFTQFLLKGTINEYTSFDMLFANRVQTKKNKVTHIYNSLSNEDYTKILVKFISQIIKGNNPSDKYFVAKFLTRPRTSVRSKHKKMLPETKIIMRAKENFLYLLSKECGFEVIQKTTHKEFKGYYEWRKEFNGALESVLFSNRKILDFDEQTFLGWLEKLPSAARFRVRCRLLTSDNKPKVEEGKLTSKWQRLPEWFLKWEKFKAEKQTEQRTLEEKVRQNPGDVDTKVKLEKVKKEAKVNVGAMNFTSMFPEIVKGTIDKVKIQPFLDKINLPYNTLVFIDDSGSMQQYSVSGVTAFDFAAFMATVCLTKNPEDTGRSLLGFFSWSCRLFPTMTSTTKLGNRLLNNDVQTINEPLIIPEEHFLVNLDRIRKFSNSVRTSNGTNIRAIIDYISGVASKEPDMLEQLQAFPVWTIISDGNWNNLHSPEASINDMLRRAEQYLGFKPFIIAIDVASSSSAAMAERFSGIENFMYIPPNPAQIEQFLTNFNDMDIVDIYTPLQSLHRSNRYAPVREAVI